ncbi:MAG TPA: hypothetical protein VIU37_13495 [Candidatus Limnocylindrales bacterium]
MRRAMYERVASVERAAVIALADVDAELGLWARDVSPASWWRWLEWTPQAAAYPRAEAT